MNKLEKVLAGYLEAAEWANAPEGSSARFPKAEIERARTECTDFITTCGPLFAQAMGQDGYSPEQFGRDFWLTRCGHGVGFWDRKELEVDTCANVTFFDRDKKTQAVNPGTTLGDSLTTIAYGSDRFISKFAHASLTACRGWLYFF